MGCLKAVMSLKVQRNRTTFSCSFRIGAIFTKNQTGVPESMKRTTHFQPQHLLIFRGNDIECACSRNPNCIVRLKCSGLSKLSMFSCNTCKQRKVTPASGNKHSIIFFWGRFLWSGSQPISTFLQRQKCSGLPLNSALYITQALNTFA